MFGGVAHPAPPQDRTPLDEVVQPRLSYLGRRQVEPVAVVGKRAQKGESTRDVVVRDDKRNLKPLVDIVGDLAQSLHDLIVGPPFEGAAQIDADHFAEHARIDAFQIVRWQ